MFPGLAEGAQSGASEPRALFVFAIELTVITVTYI